MAKKGMTPKTAEKVRVKKGLDKGAKIRRMRVKRGLSQSELSAISGVPLQTVRRYEQNTEPINSVKIDTLCSLCLALGCHIEDVIESKELLERYRLVK